MTNVKLTSILIKLPISLSAALEQINSNGFTTLIAVGDQFELVGVITEGDIRRLILKGKSLNFQISIEGGDYNKTPKYMHFKSSSIEILKCLNKGVACIPLVDDDGRVIDFSTREKLKSIPISSPIIGLEEIANVNKCLTEGWISSQGDFISQFEGGFERYLEGGFAVAVSNGTVALELGLKALGIGYADEVIVPNFTFGASVNSILNVGAVPVIVDVNPDTWTIDINEIKNAISSKTKAIMPVHIYGQPAELSLIYEIAKQKNLSVIEDCAEALGAKYKGRLIGSFGDCCCFSFFANKLITTGEGGMVVFRDKALAERARMLRDHGMNREKRYWHDVVGSNYRMTNIQAAIGVAQVDKIEYFIKSRQEVFGIYEKYLNANQKISFLPKNSWSENSYWLFTIKIIGLDSEKKEALLHELQQVGVQARPAFYPMHRMAPFRLYCKGEYPVSSEISDGAISLPTSPGLSEEDIRSISIEVSRIVDLM